MNMKKTVDMGESQRNELSLWLSRLGVKKWNPMQESVWNAWDSPESLRLISPTGSGKTLAFLLYALRRMDRNLPGVLQSLIIVPTRELAQQIESSFRSMQTGIKVVACYGGRKREIEENSLTEPPGLIVGTPGRLADHLRRNHLDFRNLKTVVLDEFDKTLESGFEEETRFLIESIPSSPGFLLSSATENGEIPDFLPSRYRTMVYSSQGEEPDRPLEVKICSTDQKDKSSRLWELICHLGARPTIVFCNHRDSVERLWKQAKEKGLVPVYYHGAMEQRDRDLALAKFRNGSSWLLITTDLASRGLDIPFIRYIIHYHLPLDEQSYVHRNGRTARMKSSGTAILLLSPEETIPPYLPGNLTEIEPEPNAPIPAKPKWGTLFLGAGKKDKISKGDILGFLTQKGQIRAEDVGIIEVKDYQAFVGIRRSQLSYLFHRIQKEKIKNKKVRMEILKT